MFININKLRKKQMATTKSLDQKLNDNKTNE